MSALLENAQTGCDNFKTKMAEIFPTFMVYAGIRKILGECLTVDFYNVADKSECASDILMNATGHMRFMMHLADSKGVYPMGTPVEIELLTWGYKVTGAGIKFRKIKGKTPAEALQKLAAWFAKNADKIRSL